MRARLPLLLALLTVAWGCASAKGAYTDGMAHETAGDYAAAAAAYATALERDRTLPNVAGRLRVAGREAVRAHVARAAAADPEGAADAYLAADALLARAAAVGVEVARPPTFEADRNAAFDDAIDALFYDADARLATGDFAGALARALGAGRFRPSADQAAALADLVVDAHLGWAEADLAAGRYRAALGRVEDARPLGPGGERWAALDGLRLDILDAGRVVAAVFPVERGEAFSEPFRRDLFDVIVEERMAHTDPFLALVDPAEVRRWDRRRRGSVDLSDSPRRLAEAAAVLGADVGAVLVLGPLAEQEVVGEARAADGAGSSGRGSRDGSRRESSRTGPPRPVRDITLTLTAGASVVAADAGTRATVCDRSVREQVSVAYEVVTADGNAEPEERSRLERAAADRAADAHDEALDRLLEGLATALAAELDRCLGTRVG